MHEDQPPGPDGGDLPTRPEDPTLDATRASAASMPTSAGRTGAPPSTPGGFQLASGQELGAYRILRPLGQGGMGEVYEAEDLTSGHRVALKILMAGTLGSETQRKRFLREGLLAASINHPHSLYVYGTEEIDGVPLIAMELLPGGTLRDRVDQHGPMPVAEAVDATRQIIEGLQAAHAKGILHRDIKPANCFVDADGSIKIGDYGLSIATTALEETQLTAAGAVLGTPAFASPEQLRGLDLDVRTDIYSLGATLYYLLTGKVPFEAGGGVQMIAAVLADAPVAPRSVRPDLPKRLERVVLRCLAKDTAERFQSYDDLSRELQAFDSTAPEPTRLGNRFTAGIIDHVLIGSILTAPFVAHGLPSWRLELLSWFVLFLYGWLMEGLWGATVGKLVMGIRVIGPDRTRPGLLRSLPRSAIFWSILTAVSMLILHKGPSTSVLMGIASLGSNSAVLLLFVTARRANGWTAVHDRISDTRVIMRRVGTARAVVKEAGAPPPAMISEEAIGPYAVIEHHALPRDGEELVLALDPALQRRVWILKRPLDSPSTTARRRDLSRQHRLRWLNGRRSPTEAWDAYEALDGAPLLEVIREQQSWRTVRSWLLQLGNEICLDRESGRLAGAAEDTALELDRIWIQPDGRPVLLDFPAPRVWPPTETEREGDTEPAADEPLHATQRFLHEVAIAALRGPTVTTDTALPLHATHLLGRLQACSYDGCESLLADLQSCQHRPPVLTRRRRLLQLAPTGIVILFMMIITMVMFAFMDRASTPEHRVLRSCLREIRELEKEAGNEEARARITALEIHIAGPLRSAAEDSTLMISFQRVDPIGAQHRSRVRRILASHPDPSAEEIESSNPQIAAFLERTETMARNRWVPYIKAAYSSLAFVPFILAPVALLLGFLTRGGPTLRMFDIAIVTRGGTQISYAGALLRSIVTWSPFLIVWIVTLAEGSMRGWASPVTPWMLALFMIGVAVSIVFPRRGLQDIIMRTSLVPR